MVGTSLLLERWRELEVSLDCCEASGKGIAEVPLGWRYKLCVFCRLNKDPCGTWPRLGSATSFLEMPPQDLCAACG